MKKNAEVKDKLRVSFSQIDTYLRCPKQWYWRYIEGKKEIPGIALLEGSSHHKAFQENNLKKKEKGRDLKARQLTDIFADDLKTRLEKEEDKVNWGEETFNSLHARAKVWHEKYANDIAPHIAPDKVEEMFKLTVKLPELEFDMNGFIDLTHSGQVKDYKTTSEYGYREKKKEVNTSLQLSYYSHATGLKDVGYICLIKGNNPDIGILPSRRSKSQIKWALDVAGEVVKGIQKKSFPMCNPTSWCCDPRWCGFYKLCRGKVEK
jgi:CRISPR/Cas system-associated exonuclease Cas4 (RecB family)